jgi:pimeloyl-ACP methyl ester carboxylesterase
MTPRGRPVGGHPSLDGTTLFGKWNGQIEVPGMPIDIGVNFTREDAGTIAIPIQNVLDLPLEGVTREGRSVRFAITAVPGDPVFRGWFDTVDLIAGDFTQAGQRFAFALQRGELTGAERPQEPRSPWPYHSEDVLYRSGDVSLAGTLTLPDGDGPFTAVLLITGSGAHDRNESLVGHKPFLVLADTLTRAGYAVLRVDDRGVGGSGGDKAQTDYDTLCTDVLAGVDYLRGRPEIDPDRIGLLGHSEGGYLAPLAAQREPGAIAFVIMLAGPAVPGHEVLVRQTELITRVVGLTPAEAAAQVNFIRELVALLKMGKLDRAQELSHQRLIEQTQALPPEQRPSPEQLAVHNPVTINYAAFVTYDPAPALAALDVPVLATYGERDLQVPAAQNEPALRGALADNPDATVHTLDGLNHLLQPAISGNPTEYASIETTLAPQVLDLVGSWLTDRFPPAH